MSDDPANWEAPQPQYYKPPMTPGTSYHPTFADVASQAYEDEIEDRKSDRFQVFVQALIDEHLGRITFALEQIQQSYTDIQARLVRMEPLIEYAEQLTQSYADIQARLVRMEPLIEYAEQLVEQRARISKWIPGKKS